MSKLPPKKNAREKLEEMLQRVRAMPPGGDLASLLTEEIGELAAAAEKEALREREKAENDRREAGFPPSGQSPQ